MMLLHFLQAAAASAAGTGSTSLLAPLLNKLGPQSVELACLCLVGTALFDFCSVQGGAGLHALRHAGGFHLKRADPAGGCWTRLGRSLTAAVPMPLQG